MELQKPIKEIKMEQQKISLEFKLSKNYNSVMLGIQDEPIVFGNEDELRKAIRKIARILREEVEHQLSLIGTKEIDEKESQKVDAEFSVPEFKENEVI